MIKSFKAIDRFLLNHVFGPIIYNAIYLLKISAHQFAAIACVTFSITNILVVVKVEWDRTAEFLWFYPAVLVTSSTILALWALCSVFLFKTEKTVNLPDLRAICVILLIMAMLSLDSSIFYRAVVTFIFLLAQYAEIVHEKMINAAERQGETGEVS